MEQQVNKQLIRKYLNGKCSASELQVMGAFLQRADAEQLIDQVWAEEWAEFQETEISDEKIADWKNRFLEKRLQDSPPQIKLNKPRKRFFSLRYAAVWLTLFVGLAAWFGIHNVQKDSVKAGAIAMFERINPNGQRVQIRLSDSSIVYLAGGSKLRYPSSFSGSTREISLDGEAFFEITKNPKKPFIIHTGDIKTLVVGTSFRINAFKSKPFLIEVATGKVRIAHQKERSSVPLAILTPGQSMLWKNNQVVMGQVNAGEVSQWKNGKLVFNHASLSEIASDLERWYNVKISFNRPRTAKTHITITLTANVPLSEIMDVLAQTVKFEYHIKERQVIIN